jgi:hypothetical protein
MTALAAVAAPPQVLTFEEEPHIYRVNGKIVPSVTQIIRAVYGDLVWPWWCPAALERGRIVHYALYLWSIGQLDPKSISEEHVGYVVSGIRFLKDKRVQIVGEAEHRMYSWIHEVAGTVDRPCLFEGVLTMADYKTGEAGWATGPQTAAYARQWQEETGQVVPGRLGVELHADGSSPKLITYNSREDWLDFLAARRTVARRALLGEQIV